MIRYTELRRRLRIAVQLQRAGVRVDPRLVAHLARQPAVRPPSLARRALPAAQQHTRRAVHAVRQTGRTVASEVRTLLRLGTFAFALVLAIRVLGPFSVDSPPPHGGGNPAKSSTPPSASRALDSLLDELEAELAAAPMPPAKMSPSMPLCTAAPIGQRRAAAGDRASYRISELTVKLERFANSHGVTVEWLPSCPVERGQTWAGIYEFYRIRICPYPLAERFDILLHEAGHMLQHKVFNRWVFGFDQHEADAISWLVQRRLGLPVAFCTTQHMRNAFGTTPADIRRRRETIRRGAEIILEALGE